MALQWAGSGTLGSGGRRGTLRGRLSHAYIYTYTYIYIYMYIYICIPLSLSLSLCLSLSLTHSIPLHSTPLHSNSTPTPTPPHPAPLHPTPVHSPHLTSPHLTSPPFRSTPPHSTPLHCTPLHSIHFIAHLCPFFFLRAASTTLSDYWKELTCGVFRSFDFLVKLRDYLKRWGGAPNTFSVFGFKSLFRKGGEVVSYIDFARP